MSHYDYEDLSEDAFIQDQEQSVMDVMQEAFSGGVWNGGSYHPNGLNPFSE